MRTGFVFCLILVFIFKGIFSVPHEFCLEPFDDDDCDEPPTPVFYYYKPGSRCEIRMWRGCPTLNRFPDEFLCSHYCIGKLSGNPDNGEEVEDYMEKEAAKNEWVEELETLDIKEIEAIDQILDHTHKKLSFTKNITDTVKIDATEEPNDDSHHSVEHEETTTETPAEPAEEHQEPEQPVTEEHHEPEQPVTEEHHEPEKHVTEEPVVTTTEHHEEEPGSADEVVTT